MVRGDGLRRLFEAGGVVALRATARLHRPLIPVELWEQRAVVPAAGGDPDKAAAAEVLLAPVGITLEPYTDGPAAEPGAAADGGA